MSKLTQLLQEVTAPERENARARWSTLTATVDSVRGSYAVVNLLGGLTRPLRYYGSGSLEVGDSVLVAVKGSSAMHIEAGGSGTSDGGSSGGGTPPADTWHDLPLTNGWAAYGGAFTPPQYRLDGGGVVRVRGLVRSGSTDGRIVPAGGLPAAYRPSAVHIIVSYCSSGVCQVRINPDGGLDAFGNASGWTSLDSVGFLPG